VTPKNFILVAVLLLSASVAFEVAMLADLASIGTDAYHSLHVTLMAILAGSQFALYRYGRKHGVKHHLALLFALGATVTGVGDFINGAISGVEPVSLKLTWALLLFGSGYILYAVALWTYNNAILKREPTAFARYRYALVLPVLALNVTAWFIDVEPHVDVSDLLYYGSFVFNATIYVALPVLGIWFFRNSGWSVGGLIVLLGTAFVPVSDLILFSSWLGGGDPPVPSFELYAYNWIVYFGGQVMVSIFPALVIGEELEYGGR
jgi:hypothetical protein